MKQLGPSTVVDALAAWGKHEANGRLKGQLQVASGDGLSFADLALRYRAPFIAHLLSHYPTGAVLVELEPSDAEVICLADGRELAKWTNDANEDSLEHFKRLCESTLPPVGPLIGAVHESGKGPLLRWLASSHRLARALYNWTRREHLGASHSVRKVLVMRSMSSSHHLEPGSLRRRFSSATLSSHAQRCSPEVQRESSLETL